MSPRESNSAEVLLRLQGEGAIAAAVAATRKFAQERRLADGETARLSIVVEELIANLYDHGGLAGQDEVILALECVAEGVRVSICDGGVAFNPWAAPSAGGSREGSAGVKLIQAWAELIDYRSSDGRNRMQLLVPLDRRQTATD